MEQMGTFMAEYAEWFYKGLISGDSARIEFQKKVFGENFKYEDYKDIFKAEMFNADEWADLFEKSGEIRTFLR